ALQGDRRVVGVTDAALDEDAGVATHRAPAPTSRLRVAGQDRLVLRPRDTVRMARADVDRFAARAVAELGPVRLAAVATSQWLVDQDQLFVHGHVGDRDEEPLALAT